MSIAGLIVYVNTSDVYIHLFNSFIPSCGLSILQASHTSCLTAHLSGSVLCARGMLSMTSVMTCI